MEVVLGPGTLWTSPKIVVACRRCRKPILNPDQKNAVFHIACRPANNTERSRLLYLWRRDAGLKPPSREGQIQKEKLHVGDFAEIRTCATCGEEFVARDKRAKVCSLWCFAPTGKYRRQAVGSVGI